MTLPTVPGLYCTLSEWVLYTTADGDTLDRVLRVASSMVVCRQDGDVPTVPTVGYQ